MALNSLVLMLMIMLMKKSVELITSDIIMYVEVMKDLLDL